MLHVSRALVVKGNPRYLSWRFKPASRNRFADKTINLENSEEGKDLGHTAAFIKTLASKALKRNRRQTKASFDNEYAERLQLPR